jgi:hypothetical protein
MARIRVASQGRSNGRARRTRLIHSLGLKCLQSLRRDADVRESLVLIAATLDQPLLGEAVVYAILSAPVRERVHAIGVHLVKHGVAVVLLLTLDDGVVQDGVERLLVSRRSPQGLGSSVARF